MPQFELKKIRPTKCHEANHMGERKRKRMQKGLSPLPVCHAPEMRRRETRYAHRERGREDNFSMIFFWTDVVAKGHIICLSHSTYLSCKEAEEGSTHCTLHVLYVYVRYVPRLYRRDRQASVAVISRVVQQYIPPLPRCLLTNCGMRLLCPPLGQAANAAAEDGNNAAIACLPLSLVAPKRGEHLSSLLPSLLQLFPISPFSPSPLLPFSPSPYTTRPHGREKEFFVDVAVPAWGKNGEKKGIRGICQKKSRKRHKRGRRG